MVQKEKCDCQGLMLAALAVGAVIGVIAGMAIYAWAYPVFQSDKWASWMQAVGSVGAILVALFVMTRSRRHQELTRETQNQIMLKGARQSVCMAFDTIYKTYDSLQEGWQRGNGSVPLEEVIRLPLNTAKKTLEQIPWFSPPYHQLIGMIEVLIALDIVLSFYSTRNFQNDVISTQADYDKAIARASVFREMAKIKMIEFGLV